MTRVKKAVASRARRKKIIKLAKGYISRRKTNFRAANEAVWHAGMHAYESRRLKKRDMRALWNIRISAGAKNLGTSYSKLMHGLRKQNIVLNRKMLSELAATKPEIFSKIAAEAKS